MVTYRQRRESGFLAGTGSKRRLCTLWWVRLRYTKWFFDDAINVNGYSLEVAEVCSCNPWHRLRIVSPVWFRWVGILYSSVVGFAIMSWVVEVAM